MQTIDLNDLMNARVHLGHRTRKWNPQMKGYIYGRRGEVHIIDLAITRDKLKEARDFIVETLKGEKDLLVVGTKPQAREVVRKWSEKMGYWFVTERWPGGLLTNFKEVCKALERLRYLCELRDGKEWESLSTRKKHMILREIDKSNSLLGGISGMDKLPKVLVVIDPRREKNAVKEANSLGIPVIALIDTNGDPALVDFPIPGNDDVSLSIEAIISFLFSGKIVVSSSSVEMSTDKVSDDLSSLNLSGRIVASLKSAGIETVDALKNLSRDEMAEIKGLGKKSVEEICSLLGMD